MSTIDDIIIARFASPVAGWFEHRFGISQWRLSLACLDGNIGFYLAGVAFAMAGKGMADGIFADLLAAVAWLAAMTFVRSVTYRQASSSMGVQSARFGEWIFRTVLIAVLPLSLYYVKGPSSFCFSLALLFLIFHLYFKASDTPPPERTRKLAYNRG